MAQLIKSLQRRSLKCSCRVNKEPEGELGPWAGECELSQPGGNGDGAVPEHTREDLATPASRSGCQECGDAAQIHPQSSALPIH